MPRRSFYNSVIQICLQSKVHIKQFFIRLLERAFKMMKSGIYFIVIALLVAEFKSH